jgi:hypothetical protein
VDLKQFMIQTTKGTTHTHTHTHTTQTHTSHTQHTHTHITHTHHTHTPHTHTSHTTHTHITSHTHTHHTHTHTHIYTHIHVVNMLVWIKNSYIILTDKYILSHPVDSLVVLACPTYPAVYIRCRKWQTTCSICQIMLLILYTYYLQNISLL